MSFYSFLNLDFILRPSESQFHFLVLRLFRHFSRQSESQSYKFKDIQFIHFSYLSKSQNNNLNLSILLFTSE